MMVMMPDETKEMTAKKSEAITLAKIVECNAFDTDDDGSVDFVEFCRAVRLKELRDEFDTYDTDGDGFIDIDELKAAFGVEGEELIALFNSVDLDGDKKITFEEFVSVMSGQTPHADI